MEKIRDCRRGNNVEASEVEEVELRRGPWTMGEDIVLADYIARNGEGSWNSLARNAGLKRTGKSCRLRWLNYLRPDVRRGNITLEEQLIILELHSRLGNRWSKIAQHLPGRTDNEIKNYWRTRVLKHAKQLKCDVNSNLFKDTVRNVWMPRLIEQRFQAESKSQTSSITQLYNNNIDNSNPQLSSTTSGSFETQFSPISDLTDIHNISVKNDPDMDSNLMHNDSASDNLYRGYFQKSNGNIGYDIPFPSPSSLSCFNPGLDFQSVQPNNQASEFSDADLDYLWNIDDSLYYFSQVQINNIL